MNISEYLENTVGKVLLQDLAPVIGVSYSTIKRIGWDGFNTDQIIQISRHYSVNPVDALVALGRIEPEEAAFAELERALDVTPTRALLSELTERINRTSGPTEASQIASTVQNAYSRRIESFIKEHNVSLSDVQDITEAQKDDVVLAASDHDYDEEIETRWN